MVHKSFTVEKFKSDMNKRTNERLLLCEGCGCGYDCNGVAVTMTQLKYIESNFLQILCGICVAV